MLMVMVMMVMMVMVVGDDGDEGDGCLLVVIATISAVIVAMAVTRAALMGNDGSDDGYMDNEGDGDGGGDDGDGDDADADADGDDDGAGADGDDDGDGADDGDGDGDDIMAAGKDLFEPRRGRTCRAPFGGMSLGAGAGPRSATEHDYYHY